MKTSRALWTLFASVGVLFGTTSVVHATETSCSAKFKELAPAAMKMSYWDFDQSEAGWRKLENCDAEKTKLLRMYIGQHESDMRNVRWHLAQSLALSGDNLRAAQEAIKSLNPDEATDHPTFSWNAYVQATAEFLRNDRAAFDVQYEAHRLATAKHAENKVNFNVLTGLAKCFGKPYKEAYIACRTSP